MSMNQLQTELLKLLSGNKNKQNTIIQRLDDVIRDFGLLSIKRWHNSSNNKKNALLHELIEKELPDVVRHVVKNYKFDVDIRRDSDGLTPFQLASENNNFDMCEVLKELGANEILTEDVSKWSSSDEDKEKSMNIVWLDLEMTRFEDPEILECAVIITDKDLNELAQKNWIIHFDQSELDKLADWHQNTFKDVEEGGNGLFADVVKSKITKERAEEELLALIKRFCPEKMCPLAGSSIHIDKGVLKICMPKVHDYLHYRIIDVTSFQAVMRRWTPWIESKIKKQLATSGQEIVNHRAMDDIKWSISFMAQFRLVLTKQHNDVNNRKNEQPMHHHRNNESPMHRHGKHESPIHHHGKNEPPMQHHQKRSGSPSLVARNRLPPGSNHDNKMQLYADEKRLLERMEQEEKINVKSLKLHTNEQEIYDANPHLREVYINKEQLEIYSKEFTFHNRFLKLSSKRFDNNNNNARKMNTTDHWGQRKLLLPEIEFLTNYAADGKYLVVYAGAAPGSHINYLSRLFPNLEFVLIDTNDFSINPTTDIQIQSEKFTDNLAKQFCSSKHNILFICNVRTFNPQGSMNNNVMEDMENQGIWHKLMKPHASLLNFRLPREPGKTKYFKGELVIEPWASRRSTECRLVVEKDSKIIDYDNSEFENTLLHFQNEKRIRFYKHNMDEIDNEGLDHCYDCRAEIFILKEYLMKIKRIKDETELKTETARMSSEISRKIVDKKRESVIGRTRTLDVIPKKSIIVSSNV